MLPKFRNWGPQGERISGRMRENLAVIVFGSNIIISIDAFKISYNPYIIIVISSPKSL